MMNRDFREKGNAFPFRERALNNLHHDGTKHTLFSELNLVMISKGTHYLHIGLQCDTYFKASDDLV